MPPDYSGQNLRGRSFKGQNLEGANFSRADIRGADFTNAFLRGADFTGAKAGLQKRWVIGLLIFVLLLLPLAFTYSISIGLSIANIFDTQNPGNILIGAVSLVFVVVFGVVAIRKGLTEGLEVLVILFVIASFLVIITLIAFPKVLTVIKTSPQSLVLASALFIAFSFMLFSIFIGWRIQGKYDKDSWIDLYITALATLKGTSFRGANLINADFTGAILKNTDFSKADIKRTRFYKAKQLNFARVDDTILTNPAVLNLLVSCNGRGKSYAGANLRGANLKGADLCNANFKGADIIVATFEGACLEGANLTLTQAVWADFTNAQMTGACIEAWNIDSSTKLSNIDCHFVYLLERPKLGTDDRERRPCSGEFQPGDFTKLFEEVLNTVDLIFRTGIDWRAFVNAFEQVRVENENTELAIQNIENKGDGVLVVKVAVPEGTDKEKIHSDFIENYPLALAEVAKYKALLEETKKYYSDMYNIANLLAQKQQKQNIQVTNTNTQEHKTMNNSNDSSRKVEIGSVGRDFIASGQALNLGEISGTVTNTINELPSAPEADKPGIKELLTQLQTAIEDDKNLSEEDKADALEEVKTLAELSQNPQDEEMLKKANKAVRMLNRVFQNIPTAVSLLDLVSKISGFLGLA